MTMAAETFGVPLKRASDIDILKPLKNLITSRYQTAEQESYIGPINDLAKLRTLAVCRTLDYHESSLETLYRYYDQIVALESKIPAAEIQIPFKWKDAFDRGSIFGGRISLTVASLLYEKVCVLYNIAALQSQVAAAQSSDSDEALKLAAKLFQSAAGIFTHLKGIVHSAVQQEPTPDLQPDTLSTLADLCVAQAQEVITVKAIKDRMKDAVVAKLCSQCDDMYGDALKHLQRETLKSLWDREWISRVAGKQAGYHALAEYHQSRVCNSNKAVGEEIARLRHTVELFKGAQTRSGEISFFEDHLGRAQRALEEAVKDNDFIYHERIPDIKSLPGIGKAPVAKPTAIPEKFCSNFTDLFETLVPVGVQQAIVSYDTRKEEIVTTEIGKLRESTQLLNSILASLNLPAAIEDVGGEKVPQSLWEKSTSVVNAGGCEALNKMITELPDLLVRNRELLEECERQLNEERESDNQLRTQFGERWTRIPSEKLTTTFQTNAQKYRKVIDTAVEADSTIREKYDGHKEGMELLSAGPENVGAALPSAGASTNGSNPAVQRLKQLMEDVETLKAERDAIECELKSATIDMKDVFLNALAQDGTINEAAISTESLGRVFGPLQKQVKESVERQESLVKNIQEAHADFCKAATGVGGEREAMLKKLAAAYDNFNELKSNLTEGTKFYNDLTQLLVNFQSKINDFCFARRTEKEELMRDLTQGLANQNVGSAPNPPAHHQEAQGMQKVAPPRPPPPSANPYQGVPQGANPFAQAPPAQAPPAQAPPAQAPAAGVPPPYGAPQPGNLPYPVNPAGMPAPQGYVYQSYPVYTPMPQGYNPYFQQQPQQAGGYPGGYPAPPYPQQPYSNYPYPPQQQQPWSQP
ncbi:programmed cell death 6-interacting protein-like [Homarus americanus]|uniref:Programmed cell death 6-interacting protein-like n=1 Tax=Homarus americanus TaxID=6706 RepID=A0A8J5T4G6_HOMAM|nr:programmed cell death 6-interacting protein-like [Homarus americanus]KAG7172531.1 programmed cell death 6-interacting protein-like [Homarus americanus]